MDIEEDSLDSNPNTDISSKNKNLSLRKQKQKKQNNNKNSKISSSHILNGEVVLKDGQIEFIQKKRYRFLKFEELLTDESNKKYKDFEEQQLSEKIIDIYNKLQILPTPGLKEDDYDIQYHDKKEKIVNDLLKNKNIFNDIRKLATKTRNEHIFCTILEIFINFCYYNNQFMIDNHDYLINIVENAFEFNDKYQTISLAFKFSYSVIEFGFFEEYKQKFMDYFIDLSLNDFKYQSINNVQGAKIYLYYIIYMIFKDAWENININKDSYQKFINKILFELSISNNDLTEIIILLINTICDNILYPKIFKKESINYEMAKEINRYLFKLISEIIINLPPNEKDKIIKDETINYIIRQSFNVITKIISGVNIIRENDDNIQEKLVPKEEKKILYEFIIFFSYLNLDEKNFLWLTDIMAKFAEISYFSDIYLKEDIINIIFGKFMLEVKCISDIFQFLRSLLEVEPLFKFYCINNKLYEALNNLNIQKNPYYSIVHFLFMIQNLLESGEKYNLLDKIYQKLCIIHTKEKMEQIFYKYGNDEIIHKKYSEIMPKLEELDKKIEVE